MKKRLVQLSNEYGCILLANTNLTTLEIKNAGNNFEDDTGLDYEEKISKYAKEANKHFERIYIDEVIYLEY